MGTPTQEHKHMKEERGGTKTGSTDLENIRQVKYRIRFLFLAHNELVAQVLTSE